MRFDASTREAIAYLVEQAGVITSPALDAPVLPFGPSHLPAACRAMRARLPRDTVEVGPYGMPVAWPIRTAIDHAELYFVTKDMTSLALSAADTFPETALADALPATVGIVVWAKSVGNYDGVSTVYGALWRPVGEGIFVSWIGMTREGVLDILNGGWFDMETQPDLARILAATVTLMMQPTVAHTRQLAGTHTERSASGRRRKTPTLVSLIGLREAVRPNPHASETGGEHTLRWYVRGHWRNQPCGPERQERRLTWVTPHIKGPEGAPFKEDRVYVWRR